MRLTERDKKVIKAVNDFRLMRQDQIQRLAFPSRNTAQVRLRLLWEHAYLRRRFLHVQGGIQNSPILYELDRSGAELLCTEFQYEEAELRYTKQELLGQQFIDHTLGLAEIRLAGEQSCQNQSLVLITWRDEKALKASYDRVMVGNRFEAVLPDAYLVIRNPEPRFYHFFLEYDRGQENLKFIKKKMAAYVAYFRTHLCQQRFGTNQIRVLTVCEAGSTRTRISRLQNLKQATEAVGGGSRFYFSNITSITGRDILFDPIWQIAGRENTHPLLLRSST